MDDRSPLPLQDSRPSPPPRSSREPDSRRSRSPAAYTRPRSAVPGPVHKPENAPDNPPKSDVLGVFGLSVRTRERDLEEEFGRFGQVVKVVIVYDQRSERSRGFGFVTMSTPEEAQKCIDNLSGIDLNGRKIRVDFSVTKRPHQSTPGEYMGVKRREYDQPPRDRYDDRRYDSYRGGGARYDSYRAPSRDDYGRDRDRDYRGGGRDRDRNRDRDDFGRDRDYRDEYRSSRDRDHRDRSPPSRRDRSPSPPRRRRSSSRSPPPRRERDYDDVPADAAPAIRW